MNATKIVPPMRRRASNAQYAEKPTAQEGADDADDDVAQEP
jgi:hypothetical protein